MWFCCIHFFHCELVPKNRYKSLFSIFRGMNTFKIGDVPAALSGDSLPEGRWGKQPR